MILIIFIIVISLIWLGLIFWLDNTGKKCPKCGSDLEWWDFNPKHDYCPNGCKL